MKTVGILGGMGSMATVDLFKKIVQSTAVTCDQDHLHIIIDNDATIPDRSDFILNHTVNPLESMITAAKRLENAGADLIAIPCNTAHFFFEDIQSALNIPMVHMMEETQRVLKGKAVLLATQGTYEASLYKDVYVPNHMMKQDITQLIYDYKKSMTIDQDIKKSILQQLEDMDQIILGCTELPLIFHNEDTNINLIDPTQILAEAIIKKAGAKLKIAKS